jgi:hypothetical protein
VVVADGLGSRRHTSQVGALLLARLTASRLAAVPAEEMLADPSNALDRVLGRACSLVDEVSHAFGAPGSAPLASTLALAWIPTDPATDTVVVGRVGDCTAFGLRESSFIPVFETNLQDPLNIVSAFLPAADAGRRKEVQLLRRADLDALVLVSDGVGEDIVGSPGVRDWLGQKWAVPCAVSRLVDSLSYRRQGSHDDRTALILWLDPAKHRQAGPDDPPDQA